MMEKEKKYPLNTTQNLTPKQQADHNLKSLKMVSDNRELKKAECFGNTQGWNYGIPGWYLERY